MMLPSVGGTKAGKVCGFVESCGVTQQVAVNSSPKLRSVREGGEV